MRKRQDIVGVILAGGAGRRMGTDKAMLLLNGLPLIQRIAGVLHEVFGKVVIVSDRGDAYSFLNLPTYPDVEKNCGPLGGIHSAFVHTDAPALFVVGCDTPFISTGLVNYICDFESLDEIKVPTMGGRVHPLCGVYIRKVKLQLEENLRAGLLSVQFLLEKVHPAIIPITADLPFYDKKLLTNINNIHDYETFVTRPAH